MPAARVTVLNAYGVATPDVIQAKDISAAPDGGGWYVWTMDDVKWFYPNARIVVIDFGKKGGKADTWDDKPKGVEPKTADEPVTLKIQDGVLGHTVTI